MKLHTPAIQFSGYPLTPAEPATVTKKDMPLPEKVQSTDIPAQAKTDSDDTPVSNHPAWDPEWFNNYE